jgi:pimeloyl-ACP methyl ester carboxylesterase
LVHGSWHGAWCWEHVTPLLEQGGHSVLALDLPGAGGTPPPIEETSLELYVEFVRRVVQQQTEPVVLVGHSLGGMVISQVAEDAPESIRRLVYLAAYLPRDGESVRDLEAKEGGDSGATLIHDDERQLTSISPESARLTLYEDCSDAVAEAAIRRLIPQADRVDRSPVCLTAGRLGRVPRIYIRTLRDRSIPPELQARMLAATPTPHCEIDSGHSPFLCKPQELATILTGLA